MHFQGRLGDILPSDLDPVGFGKKSYIVVN